VLSEVKKLVDQMESKKLQQLAVLGEQAGHADSSLRS
jgi:hypothetical protein